MVKLAVVLWLQKRLDFFFFFFFFFFFGLTGELSIENVSGSAAKVSSKIVKEMETVKY